MSNEPKAMREIHEIREKIYEETKNMTAEERLEYRKQNRQKSEDCMLKAGYKFTKSSTPGCMRLVSIETN